MCCPHLEASSDDQHTDEDGALVQVLEDIQLVIDTPSIDLHRKTT